MGKKKGKIVVSGDFGCSGAGIAAAGLHKDLNAVFSEFLVGSYFETLGIFSVCLRVSGSVQDFGGEGPERLCYPKKYKYIALDLVIPQERWRGVEPPVIRQYVAGQMEVCFEALVERAKKAKELTDEARLRSDFGKAMEKFRGMGLEGEPVVW